MLEVEPLVAAAILPAGRAARAAVFDEEVARVGVHVGDAPGKPRRAADGHDRRCPAAWHPSHIRPRPSCSAISYQMAGRRFTLQVRIGGQQRVARGAPFRAHGPGVAAGQAGQVGQQLERVVREPLGDADLAKRLEVDAVQIGMEQLAEPLVVDAQLDQLRAAAARFPARRSTGRRSSADCRSAAPSSGSQGRGLKAGDPHRQRAAGVQQTVVHALAIQLELREAWCRAGS